jgi:membrane-associated phospholipid phosphatase
MTAIDLPPQASSGRSPARGRSRAARLRTGLLELGLVLALYVGYSCSRLLASTDLGAAKSRAHALTTVEQDLFLNWEGGLNRLFSHVPVLGIGGSYYYATAHYVVTAVVLLWLHHRGRAAYVPARNGLIAATVLGLVGYLLFPTAPPRLTGLGHIDVLKEYAASGWWGGSASAPRGFGQYTNELAAMPSLHAGWALWVLLALTAAGAPLLWRRLAMAHVLLTAVVVVGTGNHWVLDVVVGWVVVLAGWWLATRLPARLRRRAVPQATADPTRT